MVVSKINNEINYDEKKQLHKNDIGKSTNTYLIELEDLTLKLLLVSVQKLTSILKNQWFIFHFIWF